MNREQRRAAKKHIDKHEKEKEKKIYQEISDELGISPNKLDLIMNYCVREFISGEPVSTAKMIKHISEKEDWSLVEKMFASTMTNAVKVRQNTYQEVSSMIGGPRKPIIHS